MTPIYFKQRGAQVVLRADSIRIIVCRRIKDCVGRRYTTYEGRVDNILYKDGRYYFIYEDYCPLYNVSNIDECINIVIETANYYINRL